jgi:hypothetical protein
MLTLLACILRFKAVTYLWRRLARGMVIDDSDIHLRPHCIFYYFMGLIFTLNWKVVKINTFDL